MKTLVTGAGGFLGGRVVEVLEDAEPGSVRAAIRRWSTAARIGRLPVEIVQADLMIPEQVASALEGVTQVVHCAVGPGDVNIAGTRNLLEACASAQVEKVVHISTIDVYGNTTGDVPETSEPQRTGAAYGDSKIGAEMVCREFMDRGLPIAILRPTIIYGPFSALWTEEFAERLQVRPWPFPEPLCSGVCNLVYVDDVVAAIRLAMASPAAEGEAFNVNGPDRPTWFEYFVALNDAMELPALEVASTTSSNLTALAMKPVRASAKLALHHFGDQIMAVYKRSDLAKKVMKGAEGLIRRTPTTGEFQLYSKVVSFPAGKAEALLGYRPSVDMDRGISLSVAWLRHSGFLDEGRPS